MAEGPEHSRKSKETGGKEAPPAEGEAGLRRRCVRRPRRPLFSGGGRGRRGRAWAQSQRSDRVRGGHEEYRAALLSGGTALIAALVHLRNCFSLRLRRVGLRVRENRIRCSGGRGGEQSPARPRGAAGVPGAEGTAGRPALHTPWRRVRRRPPRDPVGSPCTPPQAPRHVAGSACTSVTRRTRVIWPTRVTMRGLRPPCRQGDTRVTTATGTSHHPQDGCARPDAAPRPWHPPSTTGLVPA